jgi:hypothetical protein
VLLGLAALTFVMSGAQSAPADKGASPAPTDQRSLSVVREEINQLDTEREQVLRDLQTRYTNAALDQRVALEAEGAQIQTDFQRRYLELVVEYHRLTGNAEELARAERMLENLNAGVMTGTPLPLSRDLRETQAPPASGQTPEGVVRDAN